VIAVRIFFVEVRSINMARGELSEQAWQKIQPFLPPEKSGKPGRSYKNHRLVLNGILWIARTGAPWRDLPECYGPHSTCHGRLARWQKEGRWQRILQALQSQADTGIDASNAVQWEGCAIDSTSVKARPHAAGARKAPAKKGALDQSRPVVRRVRKRWAEAEVV
jgi:transposase